MASQGSVECVGEQLGVAEGVGDAVAGDRVAVVAGVADQCPARAPAVRQWPPDRPPDDVGQVGPTADGGHDPAGSHPRAE